MKTIGILQPGYLPWLGFFEQIEATDLFVIFDDVQYTRKSWRNRNRIRTSEGWMWLTVPVHVKGQFEQLVCDVTINNDYPWARKHLKSLRCNYQKSPYFNQYFSELEDIYLRGWEKLLDLDMALIRWICQLYGIKQNFVFSSQLATQEREKSKRVLELCQLLQADHLYDGAAASQFLDVALFHAAGIAVSFQNYQHPVYPQVFSPFMPYMSVVDLLFNCGTDYREWKTSGLPNPLN